MGYRVTEIGWVRKTEGWPCRSVATGGIETEGFFNYGEVGGVAFEFDEDEGDC